MPIRSSAVKETNEQPQKRPLSVHQYELGFGGTEERGTGTTIKFSSTIHLDDTQLFVGCDCVPGLSVRYLQTIGPALRTELRVRSDRQHSSSGVRSTGSLAVESAKSSDSRSTRTSKTFSSLLVLHGPEITGSTETAAVVPRVCRRGQRALFSELPTPVRVA